MSITTTQSVTRFFMSVYKELCFLFLKLFRKQEDSEFQIIVAKNLTPHQLIICLEVPKENPQKLNQKVPKFDKKEHEHKLAILKQSWHRLLNECNMESK